MNRLSRLALLALTAVVLAAGAGCGGDTKSNNDYVAKLNKAQTDFAATVGKTTAPAGGDAQDTFAALNVALDKVVADLKGVEAPDKVKSLHNQLISQMEQFSGDVKEAGAALASKDQKKILAAQTKFSTSASTLGTKIGQTIEAINKKLQE
jgi:hypothetical protein